MITFGGHLVCDRCGTPGPSFINEWDYTWRCSECGYISAIPDHMRPKPQKTEPDHASGGYSGGRPSGKPKDPGLLFLKIFLFIVFLFVAYNSLKKTL